MASTRPLILTLALALTGCSSRVEPPSRSIRIDLPEWRFSAEPTLSIGVVEGDPNYQFFRAASAVRLPAQGRYQTRVGGRGGGPGEFRALRSVHIAGPDSLLAYDLALRISYFHRSGSFLGSVNIPPPGETEFPLDVWLYRRNWVDGVPDDGRRVTVARALDRLPAPVEELGYSYVKVDQEGNLWVSDGATASGERAHWTIHDTTGTPIARASLPPRFEMFEITREDVLGRWRDELEVEHIRIYSLQQSGTSAVATPPQTAVVHESLLSQEELDRIARDMRSILRNTVRMQERHFGKHREYVTDARELDWEFPEGFSLDFVVARRRNWLAVVAHVDSPVICGMAVNMAPAGWLEGVPKCSQMSVQ
jgi:hypothetical protein